MEVANSVKKKLLHRNKLIKIADKSAGGWDTVKEYESDELASDSEDDKRLKRAESRAMAKRDKARQGRKPVSTPGPNSSGFGGNFTPGFSYDTDSGNVMQPFRGPKRSNRLLQCYAYQAKLPLTTLRSRSRI